MSRYQKGKTNLDFTGARDSEWQWYQLGHMQAAPRSRQITTPVLHYSSFLKAGCPSCRPTNSVKALKDKYRKQKQYRKIQKTNSIQIRKSRQPKIQQKENYPGSVASYNTRPGNEVGLFYNAPQAHKEMKLQSNDLLMGISCRYKISNKGEHLESTYKYVSNIIIMNL